MANPLGNGDQDKRPAQTIEGTATEVTVETMPGQDSAAAGGEEPDQASENEESGPSQSTPPPKASRSKAGSFISHLAAGLVGGIIAAIALVVAWNGLGTGTETVAPSTDVTALEQRLAKLEKAPGASPDAKPLSKLDGQVGALEDSQKANAAKLSELASDVSRLQTSLKTLSETAEEGGSVAAAAAVNQQIAEAEKRLDARIAALGKDESASAEDVKKLEDALAEVRAKLGALTEAMLEADGAGVVQPEIAILTERLAKLEAVLPELAGAIEKEAAEANFAALAIAFANLRAAVSDGRPYAAELDTLGALTPALGDLGVLPAYAETGIPTLLELARSFDKVSDEALAAQQPDGSLVGSLMTSAQSLVKIKRIDDAPQGEGALATLARAKAALDHGDLAAAVTQVESLDGPARETFSTWLGQAHARLSAGNILTRLEGALLVFMSGDTEATEP